MKKVLDRHLPEKTGYPGNHLRFGKPMEGAFLGFSKTEYGIIEVSPAINTKE